MRICLDILERTQQNTQANSSKIAFRIWFLFEYSKSSRFERFFAKHLVEDVSETYFVYEAQRRSRKTHREACGIASLARERALRTYLSAQPSLQIFAEPKLREHIMKPTRQRISR